ncbi:hypothetical protein Tco_0661774 [Tanacetum coccineum]
MPQNHETVNFWFGEKSRRSVITRSIWDRPPRSVTSYHWELKLKHVGWVEHHHGQCRQYLCIVFIYVELQCHELRFSDFYFEVEDEETKLMKETPYELLKDNEKKQLGKNEEAKMTIYNALPRKEYEFNAIVTSLKSLDPDYSSKNHVRKFLRALLVKWRVKANEVLVTKGALQSKVGHLDILEHEVERLCDEYKWWKLTRRCWNTYVLAAARNKEQGDIFEPC